MRSPQPTPPRPGEPIVDAAVGPAQLAAIVCELTRGRGWPLHRHNGEDELLVVLAGAVEVLCDDRYQPAGTGAVLLLPRRRPHRVISSSPISRVLTVLTPGAFAHDHDRLRGADVPGRLESLVAAAARHGCELIPDHRPATPEPEHTGSDR